MTGHELVWDPAPLSDRQRTGEACVVCAKAWPRPRHRVGVLGAEVGDHRTPAVFGDGSAMRVYACDDCALIVGRPVLGPTA